MRTPALRELQRGFWHAIADSPGSSSAAPALLSLIPPTRSQEPAARLQVYVDAYFGRLHAVLRENYPTVADSLGEAAFASATQDYLARHPSVHPSISYVGRLFAEFLAAREALPPHLADVARLEWTRAMVFEAADSAHVTATALRAVAAQAWPELRFVAIPALDVLRLRYPAHELLREAPVESPSPRPTWLRVWRGPDWRVLHAPMGDREAAAMQRLRAGETFADICTEFADLPDDEAAPASMSTFLRWVEDGIIAALR